MPASRPPSRYVVSDDVISTHLEGEAVVLHLGTRAYYRLNDSAAAIWRGVEQGMDRDGLTEEICSLFEVDRAAASREIDRLVADLEGRGLIRGGS